ncbi:MAG TPA: kelch repeat-containing protein [Chthoniobacterales bacterium]|nr:kelch repeat-containing protein [Chthoniobacterales bacterium]
MPLKLLFRIFPRRSTFPLLFLSLGLALGPRSDAGTASFENTGSLAEARSGHTATLLNTGAVLVVGGDSTGAGNTLVSTELYDPASGTWTATGPLTTDRADHTATLLPNGKVLVAGGRTFFYDLASAELYDPATGIWTSTGSLNVKRRAHTATLLPNGKVLVVGGRQEEFSSVYSLSSAEVYDPETGTWSMTGSLAADRFGHTTTLLSSGKVLVAGGFRQGFNTLAGAELYDPATGTWTPTGSLTTPRSAHTATLLGNGMVLVAGGHSGRGIPDGFLNSAELYNPATETWSSTGSFGAPRQDHTATLLPSGRVLIAGGSGGPNGTVASGDRYNPVGGEWSTVATMATPRHNHTATLLHNGPLLLAGGANGNQPLASAELYRRLFPSPLNISTRLHVQTGDKVLIGGFIIDGTDPKTLIVRGMGPSLPVPGALADPTIEVHGPAGQLVATNDNWRDAATSQQISESGLAPTNDAESALWGVINPGAYTVVLEGKDGENGVGSVEVYDLDPTSDSGLANISTRGFVDTGDNVMIAGFIVGGGTPGHAATVVVRALGPSIPMNGTLADPTVELHNENGTSIAFNDDWKRRPDGSNQQPEIEATHVPPSNDLESALVQGLLPGSYTAIVRGKDGSTGIGLVEAYRIQ